MGEWTVYAQCQGCAEWTRIEGSPGTHGQYTNGKRCEQCDSRFDPTSVTSERTFNYVTAKRRKPRGYKKK